MTPLSADAIAAVPNDVWRRLGDVLREVDVCHTHERVFALSEVSFEPAFRALREKILREADDRAARCLRMFWLGDPVEESAARAALGDALTGELVGAGVLQAVTGGLVSPFVLMRFMGDFLLAEDLRRGGDAVMGVGGLTRSLVEAAGQDSPGAVLDLGCGAGAVALALASRATRVVATDINPRALELTRANAAMRGITNVETRVGDLFAPVAGERFDSILSQPPFLPNWRGASYAESGARGDELIARVLREITNQLSPDGVAAIVASLPVVDGHAVESWVSEAVADELNVLVIDRGQTDLDGFAVGVSAHEHPTFGAAFDEAAVTRRTHFDRMRISELRDVMLVLSPAREKRFAATFDLAGAPDARCTRRDLVSLTRSYALCARGQEALGAARLRMRADVELARLADGRTLVRAPGAPVPLEGMGVEMTKLLEALRAGKPVGETIRKLTSHPSSHGARPGMFAATEQLLRKGLLEVAG